MIMLFLLSTAAVAIPPLSAADDGVTLTPVAVSRLYALADSLQSDGAGGYLGDGVYGEDEWNVLTGPLGSPNAEADDDPFDPSLDPFDGWTLDGLSSFAIARSEMMDLNGWSTVDDSDTFELFVNNQATQDAGGTGGAYGPEGWGYSVSYLLITYDTAPTGGSSVGDPMTVTLDVSLSGTLYAGAGTDEYFLDIGYALGTGLSDYNPVLDDVANQDNPGLDQFDAYDSWRSHGESYVLPALSDSLQYNCAIGDQVQVLIAVSSFSYSWLGYTWTDATVGATVTAVPAIPPLIQATLDIDPDTLNVKSNGQWITAYIELPTGYEVADIDLATVVLTHSDIYQDYAVTDPQYGFVTDPNAYLMDHDGDGIMERMVKFDRIALCNYLAIADLDSGDKFYDVPLTVAGQLFDGTPFEGSDTLVVIRK